jgi:hypothetical protein
MPARDPKGSSMKVQYIWRWKYSLGFRVSFVGHGVTVPEGPKRGRPVHRCK